MLDTAVSGAKFNLRTKAMSFRSKSWISALLCGIRYESYGAGILLEINRFKEEL